jgi:hypothetical protein
MDNVTPIRKPQKVRSTGATLGFDLYFYGEDETSTPP